MPLPPPAPLAPSCTPPQAPYAAWQQLGLSGAWCSWVLQAWIRALGNPQELLLAPQPHPQEEGAWQYPITPPLHSPCPQALVAIYSMPAPDEHGAGSIFRRAQEGPVCLGAPVLSPLPAVGSAARAVQESPHTAEHTQTCARGES